MGMADIRKAFVEATGGKAMLTQARHKYEQSGGYEYQRLEFDGMIADKPFQIVSDRIRAHGSLIEAAQATAQTLLGQQGQ